MQGSIDSEFILNPGSLAGFRLLTGISNTGNLPTGPQAVFLVWFVDSSPASRNMIAT